MLSNAIFTVEEIKKIRKSENKRTKDTVAILLESAKKSLESEENADLELMGFAYYYTEDEAYFKKAKETMKNLCEAELWIPGREAHGGSFEDTCELGSAAKAVNMAYAYNLFGDLLTEEEKAEIIKSTWEKGILPIYNEWIMPGIRKHSIDTMGHNWWCVMISSALVASVLMRESIPDYENRMHYGIKALAEWFAYKGNVVNTKPVNYDNGGFYEGLGYKNYSLFEYLRFACVYNRVYDKHPIEDTEILNGYFDFLLNFYYPSSKGELMTNYGDGPLDDAFGYPIYMLRYGIDNPKVRWYLNNRSKDNGSKVTLCLIEDELNKEMEMPETKNVCYNKIGWASFRDTFEKDGCMLSVKCGDTWNHAHADAGHFCFFKNGNYEIYDSGAPKNYSTPSYQQYYVQSIAHNTVLFDGKGQDYRDNYKDHARIPGKLSSFKDENGYKYVLADCTGPMSRWYRKHQRHFLWLDDFILIYDDIECYEKGECNFLLHAEENNSFKMLTPCEVTVHDGYKDNSTEPNCKYKSYNLKTDEDAHAKFVSIIAIKDDVEPTYEESEHIIKVTYGDTVIYVNKRSDGRVMHKNCFIVADGILTDATILTDTKGKYSVVNGSIVRKDGVSYLDEFARTNGYIN